MRADDKKFLITFNTRMGMFVCPCDKANVVAFLHGYQCGTGGECRFTEAMSRLLETKYKIKSGPLGWPEQLRRLAEKKSLEWMDVYLLVSSEVLSGALK